MCIRDSVYSARYCGVHGDDEANNQLLLKELENVPEPRAAHYGAAIALCRPGREPVSYTPLDVYKRQSRRIFRSRS